MGDPDCDVCWDTGIIPICWCSATCSPPCGGCEADPLEWSGETRACINCDGPKEDSKIKCDCPLSVIFIVGCQNKEEHQ